MRTSLPDLRPILRGMILGPVLLGLTVGSPAWAEPIGVAEDPDPGMGLLILDSTPRGAYAYLDGEFVGITPVEPRMVPPGDHRVWFRSRPPVAFEPLPLPEKRVQVVAGETIRVTERMGNLVRIDSDPQGAEVLVDGERRGLTPLVVRWMGGARDDLRIRRTGYYPEAVRAERLVSGSAITVGLRPLDPDRVPARVTSGPISAGVNWPAWGILAVGATSAALAVHYKNEADDAFEAYEGSADPGLQDDFLDRANRYDRFSSVAWIAAESSFLLSMWLFASRILSLENAGVTPLAEEAGGASRMGVEWRY